MAADIKIVHQLPETTPPLYRPDTLTICVLGDMMMHASQIQNAHKGGDRYDFNSYFHLLKDRISSADISIANMEFTLAGEPYTGYPSFSAPDSFGDYLASCGFDVFLTANNHILDKGSQGAERTLELYKELSKSHNISFCGTASDQNSREATTPLFLVCKGIRIALVNFTYGTNLGGDRHWPKVNYMNDKALIENALKIAEDADFTLTLPHWGTEYCLLHSEEQEQTAKWLIEHGTDMIIGTHPHVPQDCDTISDVPVIYSLGNAVSNMSAENTQVELMATVRLARESNGDITLLPIEFTYLWCSRPGGYSYSYTVLPIDEYIGKRHLWKGAWDYDKMIRSYENVRNTIGIE